MSATNRGAERPSLEFYRTPGWVTRALICKLQIPLTAHVLDAGCGDGAILEEFHKAGYQTLTGVELDPERCIRARSFSGRVTCGDFLDVEDLIFKGINKLSFGAVVMNPPYTWAKAFIEQALRFVPSGNAPVCALLRLNWLASQKRTQWHKNNPADIYILPKRPSFRGNGRTDATEYAWFVWGGPKFVGGRWEILDISGDHSG